MFELPTPVYVQPVIQTGEQKLIIWNGGVVADLQPAPMNPYVYDLNNRVMSDAILSHKQLMTPLSTRVPQTVTVHEFKTTQQQKEAIEYYGCINPTRHFVDNIVQVKPDYFLDYPTKELKVLTFDIEQYSEGYKFPDTLDPIISIAWSLGDEEPICKSIKNMSDEGKLIAEFARAIKTYDPDIIVGFNHSGYDIPVLMAKFEQYGIPNDVWSRNHQEPFLYDKKIGPRDCKCIQVTGRIIYDVYHSVLLDQVLHGVSKGLKPVAKFYAESIGIDPEDIVIEDMSKGNVDLIGTQELIDYNISDVKITRALFKKYFQDNIAIAKFTGAPMNRLVPLPSTYAGTQKVAGVFHEKNFLADSSNKDRYDWAYNDDGKSYEGATVRCLKSGLYHDVNEYDVNSLYPSIMAAFGVGPDNTKIVGTYPGIMVLKCVKKGDVRKYYVPDRSRGFTWIVEVKGISPVAQIIKDFLYERFILKRRAKEENDLGLFSRAYALKVTANSFYGMFGSKYLPYGELGVAVLVTAMGREVLKDGMEYAVQNGNTNLIADTDGFKTVGEVTVEDLNKSTANLCIALEAEPIITWDVETYEALYIKQMKTYLTLQDGKFKKHGASFKGSNLPKVFSKTIDRVGPVLLKEGPTAASKKALECYNLDQYENDDFIMNVRLGKKLDDYANPNALQPSIGRMAEARGTPVFVGQSIDYIKTVDGYDLPSDEAFAKLDKQYYRDIINDAFSRMGIDNPNQTRLEGWF